jgi:CDP-diacylglycerol--glycerol-3-phosphate 3-phosphatidyltransferase
MCLPLGVAWLWPDILREEAVFIITALVSYLLPTVYGVLKFGHTTSYHTWGAKICAVLMGASLFLLFMRISPWPFRILTPLLVLEATEEVIMTTILPKWQPNLPSLWHAVRARRRLLAEASESGDTAPAPDPSHLTTDS